MSIAPQEGEWDHTADVAVLNTPAACDVRVVNSPTTAEVAVSKPATAPEVTVLKTPTTAEVASPKSDVTSPMKSRLTTFGCAKTAPATQRRNIPANFMVEG